jgi:hypothetical protein
VVEHVVALLLKAYSANGFSRSLTNRIASSTSPTVSTGRIGPKISSSITAASGLTPASTVGARYRLSRSPCHR